MKNEKNHRSLGISYNKTYIIKEYRHLVEQKKNRSSQNSNQILYKFLKDSRKIKRTKIWI